MSFLHHHGLVLPAILICIVIASPAQAVPPPDFMINVGSQMAQFFSLTLLFLTAIFSSLHQFLRARFASIRLKKRHFVGAFVFIVLCAGLGAKAFGMFLEERALARLKLLPEAGIEEVVLEEPEIMGAVDLDKTLSAGLGAQPEVPTTPPLDEDTTSAFLVAATPEDAVTVFIHRYYQAIGSGGLRTAYNMSKKTVSYETFVSWYAMTTRVTIEKIQRIDTTRSSLELVLEEGSVRSRYAVAMTVELNKDRVPTRVSHSSARLLRTESISKTKPVTLPVATTTIVGFPFKLSNERLRTLLKNPSISYLILDAREDLEYEYGQFPGSIHIRYADLKAGRWVELPTDRPIVVLCWSGIRGSQVASFLRGKQLAASYLADGANGWVTAKGVWQGSIKFAERFPEERYRLAFSKEEMMRRVQGGAILIDAREPADRAKRPEKFSEYMHAYGMGEETGVDLPNEVAGNIRAIEKGVDVDYASASFGQGIAVTPIEMTRALAVLANQGMLPEPHVVTAIRYGSGIVRNITPPAQKRVLKPETVETMANMLTEVFDKALLNGELKQERYSISAKTGTAQISIPGGGGYYGDRYLHSFFGYFPSHDPRFIVFLYAVEPQKEIYASHTLARPFLDITKFLINYYNIPPDR